MELLAIVCVCIAIISCSIAYIYTKYLERESKGFEDLRITMHNRTIGFEGLTDRVVALEKENKNLIDKINKLEFKIQR